MERLLSALYYSALVYGILAAVALLLGWSTQDVTDLYRGDREFEAYALLGVVGLLALPLSIALIGGRWYRSRSFRPWTLRKLGVPLGHRTPAGWEQFFLEGEAAMLLVTLGDGRVIGGYFGEESLAGYTAHTPDLFLEERWSLDEDGWFLEPATGNLGVWVKADQIHSFEAYAPVVPPAPDPPAPAVTSSDGRPGEAPN